MKRETESYSLVMDQRGPPISAMASFSDIWNRLTAFVTGKQYTYTALPETITQDDLRQRAKVWADRHKAAVKVTMAAMLMTAIAFFVVSFMRTAAAQSCDSAREGFQCEPDISYSWGQYSPFYSVPSNISASTPAECKVSFAQILSRHGARYPTASKYDAYSAVIEQIHDGVTEYGKQFEFIRDYNYTLGVDTLTVFGQQELVNSGVKFYKRYEKLAMTVSPFVRTTDQDRVLHSALNWTQGFHQARLAHNHSDTPDAYPYDVLIIPEGVGLNNTLNPDTCTAFDESVDLGSKAQEVWSAIFAPAIIERFNDNLPGANLTDQDIISLMDMCPFDTVADDKGHISPFCGLFTLDEWHSYDYFQSLGKWYGHGSGHPLGPTQGVGYVNELIARLTSSPVTDNTSTNTTLDSSDSTFPLGNVLYADFSHDNVMTSIFAALGLYNATHPLPQTTREGPRKTKGYSASWAVPFAARMYVEKLSCGGSDEELVRVLVNDRVIPLLNCDADELGRCTLSKFVDSLTFARDGGHWDSCFE
ncbi:Uu.00g017750.m01.CDS01 [Anthostomella pinea]|uniref:Phytase A n=1 Tax=Anthostomella pinea TaxID=933095 RepID=A0AAI8YQP2_9PEZI|nr:Uu.00g017750.m01.CDS01 [Anthostomella pinea]